MCNCLLSKEQPCKIHCVYLHMLNPLTKPGVMTRKRLTSFMHAKALLFLFVLFVLGLVMVCPVNIQAQSISRELRSGWYPREPYQFEIMRDDHAFLTGLDIQVARELFDHAGYRTDFQPMSWAVLMEGLKSGRVDFVIGAYYSENREDFAYYSAPYRTETNAVYYHRDTDILKNLRTVDGFIDVLENNTLTMAVNEDYAYGSDIFTKFLASQPAHLVKVQAEGYSENLQYAVQGKVDFFVSNPTIMDRMLAESGHAGVVKKSRIDMGEIPVHVMFSKKTITEEEVAHFNAILNEMLDDGFIRSLHINFILPAYLAIATGQFWFVLLNYLGILAFCLSGVLLARKERYNLFGALLLATLPAIGGGVLRDLLLGADQVFVLDNPGYMLLAISIVVVAFFSFRLYDLILSRSKNIAQTIDSYTDKKLGGVFGQLYKLLDAWAVAAFTIIGVSVAIEMQTSPLWLWGPAMGVITASGGVVFRDIVRADFNITILKQDSYAEISLAGGILYTTALLHLPVYLSFSYIFYLTVVTIIVLFGFRFFVLYKGYDNPFQFGAIHTNPKRRLQAFDEHEPSLWKILKDYYHADKQGNASPVSQEQLEHLHNRFLYKQAKLRYILDELASEPLSDQNVKHYKDCSARLNIVSTIEENLFSYMQLPLGVSIDLSPVAGELMQRLHESLKTNFETAYDTIAAGQAMDYQLFEMIVSKHQERFDTLRNKYNEKYQEAGDASLYAVLQTTHKAERLIYLLGEYVKVRQGKKELTGYASNRKAQQAYLL